MVSDYDRRNATMGPDRASPVPTGTLIVKTGPQAGQRFPVSRESCTIGRTPGNDIIIQHPTVARHHAHVTWGDTQWVIHDLGSISGTFVNRRRVKSSHPLRDGDIVGLGGEVFLQFAASVSPPAAPPPALDTQPKTAAPPVRASQTRVAAARPVGATLAVAPSAGAVAHPAGAVARPPNGTGLSGWMVAGVVMIVVAALLLLVVLAAYFVTKWSPPPQMPMAAASPTSVETAAAGVSPLASMPAPVIAAGTPAPPLSVASSPTDTSTPCVDEAVYVADVTVPDGTVFVAGSHITKTWRLKNAGTCTWDTGYTIHFVGGDKMKGDSQPVDRTAPDEAQDVTVPMIAPKAPGDYTGSWRLVNARGEEFGQTYTIAIEVVLPPTATPIPTETPVPTETPIPTPTISPTPGPLIKLWADKQTLEAGTKTMLHVAVEDIAAAWLDGDIIVGGRDDREIAPCAPTTYTMDAQMKDGQHEYRTLAIDVTGSCPAPAQPGLAVSYTFTPTQGVVGKPVTVLYSIENTGTIPVEGFNLVFDPGVVPAQEGILEQERSLNLGEGFSSMNSYTWSAAGTYSTSLHLELSDGTEAYRSPIQPIDVRPRARPKK